MPIGAWRHRHPLPVPPEMVVVQPIGTCTPAEAERYRAGRDTKSKGGDDRCSTPAMSTAG